MRRAILVTLLAVGGSAWAKPWHGITPGVSTGAEVQKKLGDATRVVNQGSGTVLGYSGDDAVPGTRQVEFTVGSAGRVDQIAVFPDQAIDRATVESTFGPDCASRTSTPCYTRKVSEDDFRVYFWYQSEGLVVFFDKGVKTVESFLYVSPDAGRRAESDKGQAAKGGQGAPRLKPPPGPPPGPPSDDLAKLGGAK